MDLHEQLKTRRLKCSFGAIPLDNWQKRFARKHILLDDKQHELHQGFGSSPL